MVESVIEIGYPDLKNLKELCEKVFGKIFEGREKAKQRIIYDLLNYMKTKNKDQFLNQILKLIAYKVKDADAKKLSELINKLEMEYDTPEIFEKMGYTIIMGIMSSGSGGEEK